MRVPKLIEEARARFKRAAEAEQRNRAEALEDLKFSNGEQWLDRIKSQRELEQRPCLTINRIPQFVKQVTNEQRQNRPTVQVNPVDDGTDVETAEIMQGLIRHIEVASEAEIAYDTAFEYMVKCGFGAWRIITDWERPESFDQVIRIKRIANPFSVYWDPASREVDRSDAMYCFIVEDMVRSDYEREYPKSELAGLREFASIGDGTGEWVSGGSVRLAEYFWIEEEEAVLYLFADGSMQVAAADAELSELAVRTRKTTRRRVRWAKINAVEVLDEKEFPCQYIPVVPVYGDEIEIDGERVVSGMVRNARDPQRMYNYWVTSATETIALAPRAPFVGVEGQFEGYEEKWATANTRSWPYLEYKAKSVFGSPAPPPQRQIYEPPVQAIMGAVRQADNDLKATMGIYDASLGSSGPQESGRAILARQRESDTANLNYIDNLSRAIRHTGRILVDLVPKIYDAPRVVRIIKGDEASEMVQINQPTVVKGVERIYDLNAGRYDVTVSVGPSYSSKRQEAVASMLDLTRAYPALMQMAGDILVKNMDWPGSQEIAKRMQRALPPEFQESADGAQPVLQAQMAALAEQNQALTATVNELSDVITQKRMEIDSKERIAALQAQVQLIKVEADVASRGALAVMQQEFRDAGRQVDAMLAPEVAMGEALPAQ